jgi:hypothetical protein
MRHLHWIANRRWLVVLTLALPSFAGCLVIERKTLILVLPANTKTIELYYVFEGLSVLDGQNSQLDTARNQIDNLKADDFSFFINGVTAHLDDPLLKQFRFEKLRFFRDNERKRSLCADRRATVVDREALELKINDIVGRELRNLFTGTHADFQAQVRGAREQLGSKDAQETIDAFGMRALAKAAEGLLVIADEFDADSLKRLSRAPMTFRWLRFEPDTIRMVLPIEAANAQKIVASRKTDAWLEDMRKLVRPLRMTASDEGLSLELGGPGQAIRFMIGDARPYRPEHEIDLRGHVGNPGTLKVGDQSATAERLVEQFVKEQGRK